MQIRLPKVVWRYWDRFGDWVNVPVWQRGRIEVRRVDILIAIGGVICVTYYWLQNGWLGALAGGLFYIMLVMISLWFF